MFESSVTFSLTQISEEQQKSAKYIRRDTTKLPKLSLTSRDKTVSPRSSRRESSKNTTFRSRSNMRTNSFNQSTNHLLQTIDQSVSEKLGALYTNPKELVDTVKKMEKSKSSHDFTGMLDVDVDFKKRTLNKLLFLKKLKEDELNSLKLQVITNQTTIKEVERMENVASGLSAKIEAVKEDYNDSVFVKNSLNFMISQRQSNIEAMREKIRELKEEKEETSGKIQEIVAEKRRYEAYAKKVGLRVEGFVEKLKEQKETTAMKKENFVSEYTERKFMKEFLKKQLNQNSIKNKVSENESKIQGLETHLEKIEDEEQLESEFNACLNYIKRQDLVFSKLKKQSNVNSIEEISDYFIQLKEATASLSSSKVDLETKIELKRKELENIKKTLEQTKLNCLVEPIIGYEAQVTKKIEDKEWHTELTKEKIKRQEDLLSQLSGILTRLLYQVQGEIALHDLLPSNLPIALEKFKARTVEIFDYIDQESTVYQPTNIDQESTIYQPTKSDASKDNSVTIEVHH
ncbi:unnamed protein product [Blepharisma stoltei]|uniref:Uncharacterized protein n=1 Tax=Blepharisma stoltei TaxID=1481888 RepID=A0AAU9JX26_9CILI|nr:unnamed protein product [Blepharisma stoltei]